MSPTPMTLATSNVKSMTLVSAWIRRNSSLHELVVVSDSRLSGGESWNACPKLIPLPRPGAMVAMSGDATPAYAFLLHAINTCNLLDGNKSGRTDIGYLANKLFDVYSDSRSHVTDLPRSSAPEIPDLDVALFGWSWRHLRFEGYSYRYDTSGELRMHSLNQDLSLSKPYPVHIFGDAAPRARARLYEMMKSKGYPRPMSGAEDAPRVAAEYFWDWEPLENLLEESSDVESRTVGGPPQIAKIYQHGEVEQFVWRKNGADYFGGRPVQQHERFDRRTFEYSSHHPTIKYSDRSIYFGTGD